MGHKVTIKVGSKPYKEVEVPEWCTSIRNFIYFLQKHLETSNEISIFRTFSQSESRVYKNDEAFATLLEDAKRVEHVNVFIHKPKAHGPQIKDLTNNGGHHVVYEGASREISNDVSAGDASIELKCGIKLNIPAGSIEGKFTVQAVGSTDSRFRGSILYFSTNNK
mgnify:CR=1 FL=1